MQIEESVLSTYFNQHLIIVVFDFLVDISVYCEVFGVLQGVTDTH